MLHLVDTFCYSVAPLVHSRTPDMGNLYDSTGRKTNPVSRTKAPHVHHAFSRKDIPRLHTFLTVPVAGATDSILSQVLSQFHSRHLVVLR